MKRVWLSLLFLLVPAVMYAQAWQYIAPMKHARVRPRAVLLQNGKILVAGGTDGLQVLSSCELYDPSTNTWTDAAPLNVNRMNFQLLPLDDGRVFAAGGQTDLNVATTASCEIYDPASNTWSMTASMHDRREGFQATIISGKKILLIGGLDGDAHQYNASCDMFDEVTQTMSSFPPLVTMTAAATAVYLPQHNSVILPGGYFGGYNGYQLFSTQEYSFELGKWVLTDSLLEPQGNHYNVLVQPTTEKVFVVAGDLRTEADQVSGTVEFYDPQTKDWTKGDAITPCFLNRVVLINDDSILSIGGQDASLHQVADCWWYDCSTNKASPAPSLPEALEEGAILLDTSKDVENPCREHRSVFVFGGLTSAGAVATSIRLDLGTTHIAPILSSEPTSISINTQSPCDTDKIHFSISATSCDSVELTEVRLVDSTQLSLTDVQLPIFFNDTMIEVTLAVSTRNTALGQGVILVYKSNGINYEKTIPVMAGQNILPAFSFPASMSMAGTLCSDYDTSVTITNLGCDTLTLDAFNFSGQTIFSVRDSIVRIAPGTTGDIHLTASPSTPGNFGTTLHFALNQYGNRWDTSLQIGATVSNAKPYTIQAILKDVSNAHPGDTIEMPIYLISNLTSATSCTLQLKYNTEILEQLDPDVSGTLLQTAGLVDMKERTNSSTLEVPLGFALS